MARFSYPAQSVIDPPTLFAAFAPSNTCSTPLLSHPKGSGCLDSSQPRIARSTWSARMPAHIASERTINRVPALSPTLEEAPGTIETIQEEGFVATTPSTSSTIRPSKHTFAPDSQRHLSPRSGSHSATSQYSSLHFHHDSTSTSASESAASSPTTAPSLTESINNSETPTTSPDTPASNQFSNTSSPTFTLAARAPTLEPRPQAVRPQPAPQDLPRPSSGLKAKRNLKNLAVDTSSATAFGRAISTATLPLNRGDSTSMLTGAPTPATWKQPKFLRNKRSALGLTLVTPSSGGSAKAEEHAVPPTPSLQRPHVLRHFPSSPSLLIRSPHGPPQQVQLGMDSLNSALASGNSVSVGFHPPPTSTVKEEDEEDDINFDVPQSQEPKVETYPDGPICIYDPHVYLFYEPSAEQASKFDVIVNVAQEVLNPFKPTPADADQTDAVVADGPTADTPKASSPLYKEPEYFHIPWQHNTDIVPDLSDLAMLIDDRVNQGKKILIHCQCGVSRSASLIVAYGLYKNPSMTVQEAYDAVKRRSKWINPNMSLIMQLQEFRTQQLKTSAGMPSRGLRLMSPGQMNVRSPLDSAGGRHLNSRSGTADDDGPRSAPLNSGKQPPSLTHVAVGEYASFSPGPSSAPSGFPWPTDRQSEPSDRDPESAYATPLESPADGSPVATRHQKVATPEFEKPPTLPPQQSSPPRIEKRPAPIKLPATHLSRFHASNAKSIAESPRAAEFSMATAKLPSPEHMFGLTSPRGAPSLDAAVSGHSSFATAPAMPAAAPKPSTQASRTITQTTQPLFSPRGQEFGMTGIKPSGADDMFGLTSPRGESFNGPRPTNDYSFPAQHTQQRAAQPQTISEVPAPAEPLFSPRGKEFSMTAVRAPLDDDMFGLSSPRMSTFTAQLPHHGNARATAMSALHPDSLSARQVSAATQQPGSSVQGQGSQHAGDRAKLRSKLGMSTSSSYDMRSEYILAAKARELRPAMPLQPPPLASYRAQDDLSDALMSPRATEFTSNPFRDAFEKSAPALERPPEPQVAATTTPQKADPRSPPQKGASPIVRNIFDVIS